MRQSILLLAAATFPAAGLTAHADIPVAQNGMPFGNGFPRGYYDNLNILAAHGHFICEPPEYVDGEHVNGNVIIIPQEQGNSAITILMESGQKTLKMLRTRQRWT
jgi:hypothetical protein